MINGIKIDNKNKISGAIILSRKLPPTTGIKAKGMEPIILPKVLDRKTANHIQKSRSRQT